jgi:hypothetical protein
VLNATPDLYFATQDADDWSEPTRLARLMGALQAADAQFATSAGYRHTSTEGCPVVEQYDGFPARHKPLTAHFFHRAMHHGLYRTAALRAIGGYDGGFRVAYDMLLTNFMLMTGKVAYVDEPLYHRRIRPASLTTAGESGFRSPLRINTVQTLRVLYQQAFAAYQAYQAGLLDQATLTERIRALVTERTDPAGQTAVTALAKRLARKPGQPER